MAIDSVDSVGDVANDFDDIDWKEILDLPLWNGREVEMLSRLVQLNFVVSQIHSQFNYKGIQDNKHVQAGCRRFETLSLDEESSFNFETFTRAQFALHRQNRYEFSIADPTQQDPKITDCKNMFTRAWKGVKKGAKKVAHFVKDHKKELLIAAAAVAVVAGGLVVAGALSGAAAADAAANRRKDEDEPNSSKGTDSEPSAPPPEPDLTTPVITDHSSVDPTIQSAISSHMQTLQASRSGVEPPELHLPILPTADRTIDNLTASSGDLFSKPTSPTGIPGSSSISSALQTAWGAVQSGLDMIGRSVTAPEMQDSASPLVLFSQEEMDKLKQNEKAQVMNPSTEQKMTSSPKSGFASYLDTLKSSPGSFNRGNPGPFGTINQPVESICFHTEGTREVGTKITFINGIGNSFEDSFGSAQYIGSLGSNVQIDGVYNKSNGAPFDLAEALLLNYQGYSPVTQDLLMKEWSDFHIENRDNPDAKILHFCHSQGAIHTYNALMRLPKEIRNRIIVVAIAPAKIVPEELCYQSYNYASKNDPVHLGEDLIAQYDASINESNRAEILKAHTTRKTQLILLDPRSDAIGIDHGIQSPTFIPKIEEHIKDYINHAGEYK